MTSAPTVFVARDYSTYLATSLVYLEQARSLIEQTLSRDSSGVRRDPSNYWYNEWAGLADEVARVHALADRARRVVHALQSGAPLAGVPVPTILPSAKR